MKKYIIIILFAFPFLGLTQNTENTSVKIEDNFFQDIKMLKKGKLLVRLQTKNNVIKALKSKGMIKRAEYIQEQQKELNNTIISAFKEFKFCSVYFFYSDNSKAIEEGNYNKVKLYNNKLIAQNINLDSNFIVADFGVYPSKGRASMKSMYLRDNKLKLVNKSFPSYVRFHPNPLRSLSHEKVVKKMEKKLEKFYLRKN